MNGFIRPLEPRHEQSRPMAIVVVARNILYPQRPQKELPDFEILEMGTTTELEAQSEGMCV